MSSIMRRRSGLMAISVIGGSCLEDEVANPQSSGRDAARHHQLFILLQPLTSSSALRAALSRESGFVHCREAAVADLRAHAVCRLVAGARGLRAVSTRPPPARPPHPPRPPHRPTPRRP